MDDRIQVPLDLEDFEILSSEVINDMLEVELRSTRRPACHHCGSVDVSMHAVNERRVRDRACSYPTVLRWHQRRFRCNDCNRTAREAHPEIAGRRSVTHRFRRRLFERSCYEPHTDVAEESSSTSLSTAVVRPHRCLYRWVSGAGQGLNRSFRTLRGFSPI